MDEDEEDENESLDGSGNDKVPNNSHLSNQKDTGEKPQLNYLERTGEPFCHRYSPSLITFADRGSAAAPAEGQETKGDCPSPKGDPRSVPPSTPPCHESTR